MIPDDDLLLLSGIQHMAFCERQWALIHIEQVWAESSRTVEGKHLHERVDDPYFDESRKNLRIVRGMPLVLIVVLVDGAHVAIRFTPKCGWSGKWRPEGRSTSSQPIPARSRA